MNKHVYANQTTDWYVAESKEHAIELSIEFNKGLGLFEDELDLEFEQVADDKILSREEISGQTVKKIAAEWAADNEPGFLMTSEY